ncbi:biotin-dependent carboxyltransferase family protein [Liquorilactobacillus oeni]|uniref:Carboxyltransferase domain-containing protein n=1 Tax=Liquorilactobacillus oeni DSM 19972 TaxID=1423777 RepID=A0A0R1MK81_9LACO|nr:biotin-dependent carboxyltransferase family protein [Liquorilactobacillus oeni]KRL05781.1 hypothetical protein FD46_GL000536 [Liquorilactobacillus oeni DSM 19972]
MRGIEVVASGLATTIQDIGRIKYQSAGFPSSGAIDHQAHCLANALVNNEENAATIEYCLMGPTLKFTMQTFIALTGGTVQPQLNSHIVPMNQAVPVHSGDVLKIGNLKHGRFGYLAVAGGGIQVPEVLGSKSTTLRIELGGFKGRTLEEGDLLPTCDVYTMPSLASRKVSVETNNTTQIRFVKGPQWNLFSEQAQHKFMVQTYHISNQADRMGYRLRGKAIEVSQSNMLSEGTVLGNVQITRDGSPIVLLADRQTTGGYPVIATVIAADLGKLIQFSNQMAFNFVLTDIETAVKELKQQIKKIQDLRKLWQQKRYMEPIGPARKAALKIGKLF